MQINGDVLLFDGYNPRAQWIAVASKSYYLYFEINLVKLKGNLKYCKCLVLRFTV